MIITFKRLKEKEIKNLFIVIEKELQLIKEDIKNIKNENIPENIKLRIKKLEVITMGVEEQIISLEDRMRVIETSFQTLEATVLLYNADLNERLDNTDNEIIDTKALFNTSLQELDDRKEDKPIIEPEPEEIIK